MWAFYGHDTAHADKPAQMQPDSGKRAHIRIQNALRGTSLLTNPRYMYTCIRINNSKIQSATAAQRKVHWHTPHNANEPIYHGQNADNLSERNQTSTQLH